MKRGGYAGWFSQSHGGYNSNPNLSNCPRSSHYTSDLIQTFAVAEVKAKFRTAAPPFAEAIVRVRIRERKYVPRGFLRRFPRVRGFAPPRLRRRLREFSHKRENGDAKKITLLNYESYKHDEYREYTRPAIPGRKRNCGAAARWIEMRKANEQSLARGACKLIRVSNARANRANCP